MTPAKRLILMGRMFKNLASNGNFINGTNDWSVYAAIINSVENGVLTFKTDGSQTYGQLRQIVNEAAVTNTKYYAKCIFKALNSDCSNVQISIRGDTTGNYIIAATQESPILNTEYSISGVATIPAGHEGNIRLAIIQYYAEAVANREIQVQKIILYNITNLPAEQQAKEWCDANIPQNIIW